jgi:probable rRNA maturation factor
MLQPGIFFHFPAGPFHFPDRRRLKLFLNKQIRKEGPVPGGIHYVFCTDDDLHQMNLQYLDHDTYTDIITFPLSKKGEPLIADIYVSIDRVRDNAVNLDTRFLYELHRVIFHGALHLCGCKDKTPKEAAAMRKMEDLWLSRYFRST